MLKWYRVACTYITTHDITKCITMRGPLLCKIRLHNTVCSMLITFFISRHYLDRNNNNNNNNRQSKYFFKLVLFHKLGKFYKLEIGARSTGSFVTWWYFCESLIPISYVHCMVALRSLFSNCFFLNSKLKFKTHTYRYRHKILLKSCTPLFLPFGDLNPNFF